jgi:hypothetical protein
MSFYFFDQERKIPMKSRLSPCEANPVDPTLKRAKASKNLFKWNRKILLWMKNERVVMAVWTPKVAIRKEENRTNFPWPIYKGGF